MVRPIPSSCSDIAALSQVLAEFIDGESDSARDQHLKHIRRPIEERVRDERCLAELSFSREKSDPAKRHFHFECKGGRGNSARFREGDRLLLHQGDYESGAIDVFLVRESERSVTLRPESGLAQMSAALSVDPDAWVLDEGHFDARRLLRDGLENAMASADGRDRVMALFAGVAQAEMDFGFDDVDDGEAYAEEAGLNESQTDALVLAASTTHCHLVQGPPGTGKTYVLARTVATLVERGERVLVTAFTHRAIHHALRACHAAVRDADRIAKIGVPIHDPDLAPLQQFESWAKSPMRHVGGGLVIGATPFAAGSKRLADVAFDTVVVDEASQMTIPLAILALNKGKKFIFFGDHRQLPPVLQSVPKRDAASWSVFGSLARNSDVTTLNTTYRLNRELARWPSENFYSGELTASSGSADRHLPMRRSSPRHPALASARSLVFVEVEPGAGKSRTSAAAEAEVIGGIVDDAIAIGLEPGEIGVVTPYRRQARLIKRHLRLSPVLTRLTADEIVVDTVERFQGQERELILFSLTTSDPSFLEKVADFYFQEERWNVAATRARSKLIIVGSRTVSDFEPIDPDLAESVALVRGLIDSAELVKIVQP